jgi:hypothetical protein
MFLLIKANEQTNKQTNKKSNTFINLQINLITFILKQKKC